jgi:hypothetical protein
VDVLSVLAASVVLGSSKGIPNLAARARLFSSSTCAGVFPEPGSMTAVAGVELKVVLGARSTWLDWPASLGIVVSVAALVDAEL